MNMIKIPLENALPGMKMAKNLYNPQGYTLLAKEVILTEQYIDRLKELGVSSIYIQLKDKAMDEVPEVISEETKSEAICVVNEVFTEAFITKKVDITKTKQIVNNLVDEILSNQKYLIQLSEIRTFDNYIFAHSVDVAILSILTGMNLGYNQIQLRDLGLGALFHDIGMVILKENLTTLDQALTSQEFEELSNHPLIGFNILKEDPSLSLLSAHVALQHHEYLDGSGYPRGLKGDEILPFAKIVAIADAFDNMVNNRLPGKAYLHDEAIRFIQSYSGKLFDKEFVHAFLVNIALYPIGSIVQLSTGEQGIVIDINKNFPLQPIVRIIRINNQEEQGLEDKEVDLSRNQDIKITKTIPIENSILPEIF
jgi:HD-GYP domain-containing protein (c-di-GMP phosphodiesterase class II)